MAPNRKSSGDYPRGAVNDPNAIGSGSREYWQIVCLWWPLTRVAHGGAHAWWALGRGAGDGMRSSPALESCRPA
ncbi:hypothetical protein NHX12_008998 [Muraenolepis orangiensis]|uniref:Uncharacterized protein n=1 Tax=Muraenolepis orangiensis TaxID=630683 RepID=A0A9Q0DMI8_9TELE|nr:hypothetical protein NHX12_008998 [Muraenolepis orangiensis]